MPCQWASFNPITDTTIPATNTIRSHDTGSAPLNIAYATVSAPPMPTHTAYDVPTGIVRIANARPIMLAIIATRNTTDGTSRLKLFERPRAVAHTASNTPDTTSTSHDTIASVGRLVALRVRHPLVRDPVIRVCVQAIPAVPGPGHVDGAWAVSMGPWPAQGIGPYDDDIDTDLMTLDVAGWVNSAPVDLADLRGRVVLIEAFQMLCPGCVSHGLPQAQRVRRAFDKNDVMVLGLHTVFEHHDVMGPDALTAFVSEYKITFPVAIDRPVPGRSMPATMTAYQLQGTPTTMLVDRAGRLRHSYLGAIDDLSLGVRIGQLLSEPVPEPVSAPESDPAAQPAAGVCRPGEPCT